MGSRLPPRRLELADDEQAEQRDLQRLSADGELMRRCEAVLGAPLVELETSLDVDQLAHVLVRLGCLNMGCVELIELATGRRLQGLERRWASGAMISDGSILCVEWR